jgi:decaprenylphospho-beta-D-erythro-pentofuranosid-2-ulose 2-reductase
MSSVLIIGATSAIAEATARRYAVAGHHLVLCARNEEKLKRMASDLEIRGARSVTTHTLDAAELESHGPLIDTVFEQQSSVDVVLLAHGTLPDQQLCQQDFNVAHQELQTNAIGTLSLLTHLANKMEQQQYGTIAVITSVAGDRGRQSNYLYGAAKGMVSVFLQGLRNRLYKSGVHVVDIKPGFVDTPMTASFKKGLLWAQPDAIAKGIIKAINKKKSVAYLPGFWRLIMLIIQYLPPFIFNRLSL